MMTENYKPERECGNCALCKKYVYKGTVSYFCSAHHQRVYNHFKCSNNKFIER